jgi:hypothetical protein
MNHITPNEEELILEVATHQNLDEQCWRLFTARQHPDRSAGETLQRALYEVFPAEVNACERIAYQNEKEFWEVAAEFIQRGLFQKPAHSTNTIPPRQTSPPVQSPLKKQTQRSLTHPNLNPWWDETTIFTEPSPVDDYLLMSHTS